MMGCTLQLTLARRCDVCRQLIDEERAANDSMDAALFGAVRYAFCVGCRQAARRPWSPAYRRRWETRLAEQQAERVQEASHG